MISTERDAAVSMDDLEAALMKTGSGRNEKLDVDSFAFGLIPKGSV